MSHPETSHTAGAVAGPGLAPKLAESGSVKAACEATVAHIHAEEGLMPSVYVHRGGRLRCLAARGYWQAFDGMLPGAGVIGTTFQTGTTTFVPDTTTSSGDYLEAAPKVRSEICAPIELEGIVVGALNVEAEHRLDASRVAWIEGCAELLGERIAELGGLPMESRSQRLARHSASIAGLVEEADVFRSVLEAAIDVSEMESAAILRRSETGTVVGAAAGPHARAIRALPGHVLDQIVSWAVSATSTFTVGEPNGAGFAGHEALREAGAEAVITLSLGSRTPGTLLLLDSTPGALDTDDVELLELLVTQASSCLSTSSAVRELRDRAGRDALTRLGHHATFHERLVRACAERRGRQRLTLLIADIDGFKQVNDEQGHQAGDALLVEIADAMRGAVREGDLLCRIGGDEFAALVWADDPSAASNCGRRILDAIARLDGPTVSIGLALYQPSEGVASFFGRADQAMFDVKRAGGDALAIA